MARGLAAGHRTMITERELACIGLAMGCRCRVGGDGEPGPWLWERRPALPPTVLVIRRLMRRWTQVRLADDELGEAIVLAVDEAVSNAVEHAYRGPVGDVQVLAGGRPCQDGVAVMVSDHGAWSTPAAEPGFRGRGLAMMRELADRHSIDHSPSGTTVRLCWSTPVVG